MSRTNYDVVTAALRGVDAASATGNMSTNAFIPGDRYRAYGAGYLGYLPKTFQRILARQAGTVSQIIYSYSTPIAWCADGRWIIPQVTYSPTTSSKHQSQLYRLDGERIYLPRDVSDDETDRVMAGLMVFTSTGTRPGPNWEMGA